MAAYLLSATIQYIGPRYVVIVSAIPDLRSVGPDQKLETIVNTRAASNQQQAIDLRDELRRATVESLTTRGYEVEDITDAVSAHHRAREGG